MPSNYFYMVHYTQRSDRKMQSFNTKAAADKFARQAAARGATNVVVRRYKN